MFQFFSVKIFFHSRKCSGINPSCLFRVVDAGLRHVRLSKKPIKSDTKVTCSRVNKDEEGKYKIDLLALLPALVSDPMDRNKKM